MAFIKVYFDSQGGDLKNTTLFYAQEKHDWWPTEVRFGVPLTKRLPERDGFTFTGWWTGVNSTGSQVVPATGLLPSYPTGLYDGITLYAGWTAPHSAKLQIPSGFSGGVAQLFYADGAVYSDYAHLDRLPGADIVIGGQHVAALGPIDVPSKECHRFDGYWQNSNQSAPGTQYVTADGYVLPALVDALAASEGELTIYPKTAEASKKFTLNKNGGTTAESPAAIYCPVVNGEADRTRWYADHLCAGEQLAALPLPGKVTPSGASVFGGYKNGNVTYIGADGEFDTAAFSNNPTVWTATASWIATKKITINLNGGTGVGAFYYCADTEDSPWYRAIDGWLFACWSFPPPEKAGCRFTGSRKANNDTSALRVSVSGVIIDTPDATAPVWPPTSNQTVYARWEEIFQVTFADSGMSPPPPVYAVVGSAMPPLAGIPVFPYYDFGGYYDGRNGSGKKYYNADGTSACSWDKASDTTLYAKLIPKKFSFTRDPNGGTLNSSASPVTIPASAASPLTTDSGNWWTIGVPARAGYVFEGWDTSPNGGTMVYGADGKCVPGMYWTEDKKYKGGDLTVYAHWTKANGLKLLLDAGEGTGGIGALWLSGTTFYTDSECASEAEWPLGNLPVREGYDFAGYHEEEYGGGEYITAAGAATAALDAAAASGLVVGGNQIAKLTAKWTAKKYSFTRDPNGGTLNGSAVPVTIGPSATAPLTFGSGNHWKILVPYFRGRRCTGWFTAASGGTMVYDADGVRVVGDYWTEDKRYVHDGDLTVYAQWRLDVPRIALDDAGGSGGSGAVYCLDGNLYADEGLEEEIDHVAVPRMTGHEFVGYSSGGVMYIGADGTPQEDLGGVTSLRAEWRANTYTLSFSDGSPSIEVTYGAAIGTLPRIPNGTSTHTCLGWTVNGVDVITAQMPWTWDTDAVAGPLLQRISGVGNVDDWFNLGSANLVPFESDEGTNRPRVVTRHYGSTGADQASGLEWRNPVVKYMVVGDMTLTVTLGKAFSKTPGKTGYMITYVTVETGSRRFPVVTVHGTANEGVDAINKFQVSISLRARARAQNLLSAVSGGGELQTCSVTASCTPVVLTENMVPCASDVVGGRYELHAETSSPTGQDKAPGAAASSSFTLLGTPVVHSGTDYVRYRLAAVKEIAATQNS